MFLFGAVLVVVSAAALVWYPDVWQETTDRLAADPDEEASGEDLESARPDGAGGGVRPAAHLSLSGTSFEMPCAEKQRVEPLGAPPRQAVSPGRDSRSLAASRRRAAGTARESNAKAQWNAIRPLTREEQHTAARRRSVFELVEDLRDDDVRWNATAAAKELIRRMHDPGQYPEVWRELDLALSSPDEQQRRIAIGLLQSLSRIRHPGVAAYIPSERLLDLTADLLDHWDCWFGPRWIPGDVDDEKSVAFAVDHLDRMEERLARKLITAPPRMRFIHAYILAREGRVHLAPLAAPVLVKRLRDNYIRDDALMSMEALFRLGVAAIPWLHEAIAYADAQQRDCIELLLWEYADPASTPVERARRRHLNRVTWKCDDPVQSWRYRIPSEY